MIRTLQILLVIGLFHSISSAQEKYYGGANGKKLDWVMYYLNENYVDSTDNDLLADIAIRRIVEELDPYSSYQSKQEFIDQTNKDQGFSSKGAGFNFYLLNGTQVIVTHITKNGPAEKAGLRKGEQIVNINGVAVQGKSHSQIDALINDATNDILTLNYFDKQKQFKTIAFTKENLPYYSIDSHYMLTDKIGYIKISRFNLNTMAEFNPALKGLIQQGMKELVLDLRGNYGGVKDQAVELADVFLKGNKLIHYAEGQNLSREDYLSTENGEFQKGKLLLLVDKNTASASEIFVAALQDWDRCLVMGTETFGKGLVQQSFGLGDSSALRLTIGRYYSPTGRSLQRNSNFPTMVTLRILRLIGHTIAKLKEEGKS